MLRYLQSLRHALSRRGLVTLIRAFRVYYFGRSERREVPHAQLFFRLRSNEILGLYRELQAPHVRLWVDGPEIFPRLERLVQRAQHTIGIQMFIWNDDQTGRRLASRVLAAADRGVSVSITKEAIGDVFELHEDFLSTSARKSELWKRFWHHPNISINWAKTPDHAKIFLIDDHTLLVGSMNISDLYRHKSHDYLVELQGNQYVLEYLQMASSRPQTGARMVTNSAERKEVRPAVMGLLQSAKRSIVLEQAYFSDRKVVEKLAEKSLKGVKLTLIFAASQPTYAHQNKKALWELLEKGAKHNITIRHLPRWLHAKSILVDDKRALVGSANLMESSLDEMGEVSVLLTNEQRQCMKKLRNAVQQSIAQSRRVRNLGRLTLWDRFLAFLNL